MTPIQEAVWRLREICKKNGIYTLSSLDCFVHAGDGGTQQSIADNSHQSQSAAGVWLNVAEVNGLISLERSPHGKRKPITYTAEGKNLIDQLTQILCRNQQT